MTRSGAWTTTALAAIAALSACSGQSQNGPGTPMGEGGAAGSAKAGSSGGHAAATGGIQSDPDAGAVAAGAPGYVSLIDSGTRTCQNEDYCFGLACYAPPMFGPTVCVARCDTDANCAPFEACIRAPKLDPTCYARCDSPADCYDGFDCFDFSGEGQLVCFPAGWTKQRDDLGY